MVESGFLDAGARIFWNRFYTLGLGEFFYRNDIDPRGLANFISSGERVYEKKTLSLQEKALVPVGGGKDSIVTIEKIRESGVPLDLVTFGKENPIYAYTSDIS